MNAELGTQKHNPFIINFKRYQNIPEHGPINRGSRLLPNMKKTIIPTLRSQSPSHKRKSGQWRPPSYRVFYGYRRHPTPPGPRFSTHPDR